MPIDRRQFLTYSMASLSMAALPSIASTKKPLGVALLGLGSYSTGVLAPALQSTRHCKLTGIVTGSPEKIPRWQQRYGIEDKGVYSYETLNEIVNNDNIDVVYVVVPTALHLKYAELAANAGKHVWCEKPMAMSVQECQTMINTCRKNKVRLSIGYRMQHEPNTRLFAGYRLNKPFGNMSAISAYAGYGGGPGPDTYWRMQKAMGGGALYDMGVYAINGVRFLTGWEPTAVKANIEPTRGYKEVDATTYFSLKFENGLEADCGTSVVKGFNHLRVDCAKGWYELRPMQSYSGVIGSTSNGQRFPPYSGIQQALQMDNDALSILNNTPTLVTGEEGQKDIHIVQKAFESAYSNQEYVPL